MADHLFEGPEAQHGHVLTDFPGHEGHEVDHVLRIAGEALAQLGVLRGDADGTGVEMADAHHHAAQRDQRRRGEAELLGTEQRADDDVATGLHLAVHFDRHARTQVVDEQDLIRLGDAELPGQARVLDR